MSGLTAAAAALAVLGTLIAAAPAAAHVSVLPATVGRGSSVELTLRVPTERDVPTTAVEVEFPPEVSVHRFAEPPPGWRVQPRRAADGRITGARFAGGRIGVDRYADFSFLGTPVEEGTAVWRVRQTHADGRVKPWTGAPEGPGGPSPETGPEEPGPAAAVTVAAPGEAASAAAAPADGDEGSGAAVWLGVTAIVVAALAALGVGLLWSTRPARLPGAEEDR